MSDQELIERLNFEPDEWLASELRLVRKLDISEVGLSLIADITPQHEKVAQATREAIRIHIRMMQERAEARSERATDFGRALSTQKAKVLEQYLQLTLQSELAFKYKSEQLRLRLCGPLVVVVRPAPKKGVKRHS